LRRYPKWPAVEWLDNTELESAVTIIDGAARLYDDPSDAKYGEELVVECPCCIEIVRSDSGMTRQAPHLLELNRLFAIY
jgi:hypothetical protein